MILDFELPHKKTKMQTSNCTANQRLCLYDVSSYLIRNFKLLTISCFSTRFMSDLVGNPKAWFSPVAAHFIRLQQKLYAALLSY